MAETTRRKVYDMLVADKMRVQGFHYPFPAIGYVEKDGNGYRLVPAPWNPVDLSDVGPTQPRCDGRLGTPE